MSCSLLSSELPLKYSSSEWLKCVTPKTETRLTSNVDGAPEKGAFVSRLTYAVGLVDPVARRLDFENGEDALYTEVHTPPPRRGGSTKDDDSDGSVPSLDDDFAPCAHNAPKRLYPMRSRLASPLPADERVTRVLFATEPRGNRALPPFISMSNFKF